jgi:hypothetical protein
MSNDAELMLEEQEDALLGVILTLTALNIQRYHQTYFDKTPYHTSALSGDTWVEELLNGHPQRIRDSLGVSKDDFWVLHSQLSQWQGPPVTNTISLQEQLAIFLYVCVTGLPLKHVGERFQHADSTIRTYVFALHFDRALKYFHQPFLICSPEVQLTPTLQLSRLPSR